MQLLPANAWKFLHNSADRRDKNGRASSLSSLFEAFKRDKRPS
jgi:hypothetical protein